MSAATHTPGTTYYVGDIAQPSGKHTIYAYGDRSIPRALVTRKDEAGLFAAAADLRHVLERYMAAYPAFRMKPVGAPGSEKRAEQENLMALEDAARAAIAKTRGAQ